MKNQDCTHSMQAPTVTHSAAAIEKSTAFLWNAPARLAVLAWNLMVEWQSRSRQRQALRLMDERTLRDIGVTRAEMEQEARKPFWLP